MLICELYNIIYVCLIFVCRLSMLYFHITIPKWNIEVVIIVAISKVITECLFIGTKLEEQLQRPIHWADSDMPLQRTVFLIEMIIQPVSMTLLLASLYVRITKQVETCVSQRSLSSTSSTMIE